MTASADLPGMVSTKKVCRSSLEHVLYTLLVETIPTVFVDEAAENKNLSKKTSAKDICSNMKILTVYTGFCPLLQISRYSRKVVEKKKRKRDNYKTKSYAFQANAKKIVVLQSLIVNCEKSQRVLHQQLFEQFQVNGKGNITPPIFLNVFFMKLVFVGYRICSTSFVSKRQQFTDILPNNCSENLKRFLKRAHP